MTKNISPIVEPHPFTIDDYQRMVDTGILEEDSKVELLAGQSYWKISCRLHY